MTRRLGYVLLLLAFAAAGPADDVVTVRPSAIVQTEAVPSEGDAADDPAIWIHPQDPAKSLVLGTDKKGGLHAYRLDGREVQAISPGSNPNNVDLVYGFPLGEGRGSADLAIASVGKKRLPGIKVWLIDPANGTLAEVSDGPTFAAFNGGAPYGICCYRSPRDRAVYVFVTDRDGAVEQYRLEPRADGPVPIRAVRVRSFQVGSQAEGIVADDERGKLFVGEEKVGVWEYSAEPDGGATRTLVAKVGEHGLTADVEGLSLFYGRDGQGYLLVSSQGSSTINVYERSGSHAYVATIDPKETAGDDVLHTDGIDVTSTPTSSLLPHGFLVVQDGENTGHQNFKIFSWDDVAGDRLIVTGRPGVR